MMRKTLALALPAAALVALLAGSVRASQPVWSTRATLTQVGDRLVFTAGDFFTQEGAPVSRRVYRLLRDGTPVLGEVPPALSAPGRAFAGEGVTSYRLRASDYDRTFQLEVYAGVVSRYAHGTFVEWGGRNALTAERPNRSEPLVPRPQGAARSAATLTRDEMLAAANAQIRLWRRQGLSERAIARTRIARARAVLLRR